MTPRGIFEKVPDSGEWWIRFADATGRIRREKIGTKSAALTMYHKRKAEALQGKKLPETLRGNPITFTRIAHDALEYSKAHKRSADDDQERMKLLLDWFGETAAESLTPQEIERKLIAAARDRKWKAATVNRYKALISLTYRIALENGKVQNNPVRLVRRLREDNAVIRYLKTEEEPKLRALIEPAHPERWAMIVFAMNTGLRAGEQGGLRWKDIDLEHNQLRLVLTKNGSSRYIPLNAHAIQALRIVRESPDGSGFVFPQQPYRMWFEIALKAAGIEGFTWHCLRHTFASRLVMAGVDIRTVAELMGHRTLQMTMRYAHLAPEHKAAAVAKLESLEATDTKTSTATPHAPKNEIPAFPQVIMVQ